MNLVLAVLLAAAVAAAGALTARRLRRGGGCCGEREARVALRRARDRNPRHYACECILEIGGMTCENCARRVENALNALEGTLAKVDIASHRARVYTKRPPEEAALRAAVRDAGYAVTGMRIVRRDA